MKPSNTIKRLQEKYVDCQDIDYTDDEDGRRGGHVKTEKIPVNMGLHSALHNETFLNGTRRYTSDISGGFCEVNNVILNSDTLEIFNRDHVFACEDEPGRYR